jgi:hypothetical protein
VTNSQRFLNCLRSLTSQFPEKHNDEEKIITPAIINQNFQDIIKSETDVSDN